MKRICKVQVIINKLIMNIAPHKETTMHGRVYMNTIIDWKRKGKGVCCDICITALRTKNQ